MPDPEQHDTRSLSALLAEHARTVASERVPLADIADFLGTHSIGTWLLILALPHGAAGACTRHLGAVQHTADDDLRSAGTGWKAGMAASLYPSEINARADYVALMARIQPAVERLEQLVRPRAFWLAND